jgi:Na+/H+ antiporter NhaA
MQHSLNKSLFMDPKFSVAGLVETGYLFIRAKTRILLLLMAAILWLAFTVAGTEQALCAISLNFQHPHEVAIASLSLQRLFHSLHIY